ncbi:MAG: hypothetical protein ACRC9Q_10360, partial [Bacteroidales bacterium]
KISREAGTITPFASYFNKNINFPSAVYTNERKDRIFFGDMADSTKLDLFSSARNGDKFTEKSALSNVLNTSDNETFPFVLSDGLTIYFASDRPESIGGYDIFVSSYNLGSEEYMKPENIGFPYNSPANEYMLAIDEINNLGWLVSDRNQSADKVVIYTFIYSDTRNNLRVDEPAVRQSRAALRSLKDTWKSGENYSELIAKARSIGSVDEKAARDFYFILNNQKQLTKFSDFKNKQSAETYKQVIALYAMVEKSQSKLTDLRAEYAKQNAGGKNRISSSILKLEQDITSAYQQIDKLEAKVRELESKN